MKIFAGDSEIKEAETSKKLEYAGDVLEEEGIDRTKNLSWEQFQKLLDVIGDNATKEDLIEEISDYIDENAELEEWEDWDEDGHYGGCDQEFDWEWETRDGRFQFNVKGTVYGSIDSDPGDYWNPPYSDQELDSVRIDEATVSLGYKNVDAFEDREEWEDEGELEQYYDMPTELPAKEIEDFFNKKHERKRR